MRAVACTVKKAVHLDTLQPFPTLSDLGLLAMYKNTSYRTEWSEHHLCFNDVLYKGLTKLNSSRDITWQQCPHFWEG